jgi:hypothetical protein
MSNGIDIEAAMKRAAARRSLRASFLRELPEINERRAFLFDLLAETDDGDATRGAIVAVAPKPAGDSDAHGEASPKPPGRDTSLTEMALELMRAPNGVSLADLAAKLYPNDAEADQKRKTRAVLRWIKETKRAKQKGDIWTAAPLEPAARRSPLGDLIFAALATLAQPSGSALILEQVQKSDPNIDGPQLHRKLFKLTLSKKLLRSKRNGKTSYSLPPAVGGRNQ